MPLHIQKKIRENSVPILKSPTFLNANKNALYKPLAVFNRIQLKPELIFNLSVVFRELLKMCLLLGYC